MTSGNVLYFDVSKRNAIAASIGSNLVIDANECRNVLKRNSGVSFVQAKTGAKIKAIDGFLTAFGYQRITGIKLEITTKGWSALACKS
jgi:hypothetical protein